jgi:RNA methyltransferase, TrmH family
MAGVKESSQTRLEIEAALAEVKRLQIDRTYRDARGLFFIEGVRNFVQAMDNHCQIATILFSEKLLTAPLARKLVRNARRSGVRCLNLAPEQFRQISRTERASGVGAIAHQPWSKLPDVSPHTGLCWVVVENMRSPGNLGTLIRTSEAVGGAGFILIGGRVDPFDSDVIRASMSAILCQKFVRTNLSELRRWMHRHRCPCIGASPDGNIDLHQFNYPASTLLFLGEERQGLTQQQRELCQDLVRIPMVGTADSLNLAVAGSLLMYEVYRSRISSSSVYSQ